MTKALETGDELYSVTTERLVLGYVLLNPHHSDSRKAFELLENQDFHFPEHQEIFNCLLAMQKQGLSRDIHLVAERLDQDSLLKKVGGVEYLVEIAQFAGTSIHIEEYAAILKDRKIRRELKALSAEINAMSHSKTAPVEASIQNIQEMLLNIQKRSAIHIPFSDTCKEFAELESKFSELRQKTFLGLPQKRIPLLDEKLSGLRKLILLAAAPNTGKTAFTIQLSLDVLLNNPDACVVYFSLEMPAEDILTRCLCNLAEINYKTLVFGKNSGYVELDNECAYTKEDYTNIQKAKDLLNKTIKNRLQIIDEGKSRPLTAQKAIRFIEQVKQKTKCNRVLVVIDYLQVWPLSETTKYQNDLENDKWRIDQVKQIKEAIDGDPVIVISEARKPSKGGIWADSMSDIMGSSRLGYTPDVVLMLTPIEDASLENFWREKNIPVPNHGAPTDSENIQAYLKQEGISIVRMKTHKCRDGMERFEETLEFHFRKNVFTPFSPISKKTERSKKYVSVSF